MIINGKERGFELTVQSHEEIARQLPGNDIATLQEMYRSGSLQSIDTDIMVAIAMNRSYEDHKHYIDPEYDPDYLTKEDFRFFGYHQFGELDAELGAAMNAGNEREVLTEEIKGKKDDEVRE